MLKSTAFFFSRNHHFIKFPLQEWTRETQVRQQPKRRTFQQLQREKGFLGCLEARAGLNETTVCVERLLDEENHKNVPATQRSM